MVVHTVLFLSFMLLCILNYLLWSTTLKFHFKGDYRMSCVYQLSLSVTWALTDICNIGILSLQIYMSAKFSAPSETYRSKFLLVY